MTRIARIITLVIATAFTLSAGLSANAAVSTRNILDSVTVDGSAVSQTVVPVSTVAVDGRLRAVNWQEGDGHSLSLSKYRVDVKVKGSTTLTMSVDEKNYVSKVSYWFSDMDYYSVYYTIEDETIADVSFNGITGTGTFTVKGLKIGTTCVTVTVEHTNPYRYTCCEDKFWVTVSESGDPLSGTATTPTDPIETRLRSMVWPFTMAKISGEQVFNFDYIRQTGQYTKSNLSYNDSANAFYLSKGYRVVLFKDNNFRGTTAIYEAKNEGLFSRDLGVLSGQVSSLIVQKISDTPTVPVVYEDDGLRGKSQSLMDGGVYPKRNLTFGNDKISSILIPNGWKVTLWDDDGFKDRSVTFSNTTGQVMIVGYLGDSPWNFNDKTSSMKAWRIIDY